MPRLLIVLGTRPEAIKLAPLILKARKNSEFKTLILSTGQHREMLNQVFSFFSIEADRDLHLMKPGQKPTDILTGSLEGIRRTIEDFQPDWILTQGDTTSAAAAGLLAFYEKIPAAHVEAGLRTKDLYSPWPEEFNRRLLSLASTLHFAPTEQAKQALLGEGIGEPFIEITGNTGIDALMMAREKLMDPPKELRDRWKRLEQRPFALCTFHRRETFGQPLRQVLKAIEQLTAQTALAIVLPVHRNPEVQNAVQEILPRMRENLILCEPLSYSDFVYLMDRCLFIITDSGGVQEEGPCLGKPVLVARDTTERPEALSAGASLCVGTKQEQIVAAALRLLTDHDHYNSMAQPRLIYGDGHASERILNRIARL